MRLATGCVGVCGQILEQLREQGRPSLLDPGEMESCGVSDRLDEIGVGCVGVSSGNGSVLADGKSWNGVAEFVAEIGVASATAVAGPEIGVNGELCEIGEASEI